MVLSDREIRHEIEAGRIVIDPLGERGLQPASVDVRLDSRLLLLDESGNGQSHIDLRSDTSGFSTEVEIPQDAPYLLGPGAFALGGTHEHIELPDDVVARLEGRSSLNRIGLFVHSNAGYVDPGWRGRLTLAIRNATALPITLYRGMSIGQITFMRLSSPSLRPYGASSLSSKYQDGKAATSSRFHLDTSNGGGVDSSG